MKGLEVTRMKAGSEGASAVLRAGRGADGWGYSRGRGVGETGRGVRGLGLLTTWLARGFRDGAFTQIWGPALCPNCTRPLGSAVGELLRVGTPAFSVPSTHRD